MQTNFQSGFFFVSEWGYFNWRRWLGCTTSVLRPIWFERGNEQDRFGFNVMLFWTRSSFICYAILYAPYREVFKKKYIFISIDKKSSIYSSKIFHFEFQIGMLLSVLFILITLFVYSCIPKLRNLNGKCLMCYLVALAIAYALLSFIELYGPNYINPILCYVAGYLIYCSFLAVFSWLSVINVNIWLNSRLIFTCAHKTRYVLNS